MNAIKKTLGFCCVCIAFYIGAGFATMQEVMQYEVSYGSRFWQVILVAALIYLYTNISFTSNGNRQGIERGGEIFSLYCGKHLGKAFESFAALFCYMSFIVMCGGANSTAQEQWGLPNGAGAILLSLLVTSTVLFGLGAILKLLKNLGAVIIGFMLLIVILTVCMAGDMFTSGLAAIDNGQYELTQVGGGNPLASGASYAGFVILMFASFMAEVGARNNMTDVNRGVALSTLAIFGIAALCCVALISRIDLTHAVGVPSLALAGEIHPALASVFAFIIFTGIYTCSMPLLWTGVRKIATDGTRRYKVLTVLGGLTGCLVACFVPYKGMINVLYGINGYLGFLLVGFMLFHDVKQLFTRPSLIAHD